eukprot:s5247_g7.t2
MDQFVQRSPLSLSVSAAALLVMMGAPEVLIQLADYVAQNSPPSMSFRDLMHYDMFAGSRGMQRAYCRQGIRRLLICRCWHCRVQIGLGFSRPSDYMDMQHRADDDICTPIGMISAVRCILKLKPLALATIGLPCSSFVWINAATAKRSETNPFGNEELPHVSQGNKIAARVCLLLLLLTSGRCFFMVEQPFSTKLVLLPYVKHVFEMISAMLPVRNVFFWMGNYGHFSCKGSRAFSNLTFIGRLTKKLSKSRRQRLNLSSDGVEQNFNLIHRKLDCGPRLLLQKGKVTPPLAWQHADLEEIAEPSPDEPAESSNSATKTAKTDDSRTRTSPRTHRKRPSPEKPATETPETDRSKRPSPEKPAAKTPKTDCSKRPSPEKPAAKTPETDRSKKPSPEKPAAKTPETDRSKKPSPEKPAAKTPKTDCSKRPSPEKLAAKTPETDCSKKPSPEKPAAKTPKTDRSKRPSPEKPAGKTPETDGSKRPSPEKPKGQTEDQQIGKKARTSSTPSPTHSIGKRRHSRTPTSSPGSKAKTSDAEAAYRRSSTAMSDQSWESPTSMWSDPSWARPWTKEDDWWNSGWDGKWSSWSWGRDDSWWSSWPGSGYDDEKAVPKAESTTSNASDRVHALLQRGHTIDQLSTEDLKLIVEHIDKAKQTGTDDESAKDAKAKPKEEQKMGDEGQQEKEGVKSKDETKDERRKRLHARNMRYYRSFESQSGCWAALLPVRGMAQFI